MHEKENTFPVEICMEKLNGSHNGEVLIEEQEIELSTSLEDQAFKQKDPLAGDWSKLLEEARLGNEGYDAQQRLHIARMRAMEQQEEYRLNKSDKFS